MSKFDERFARQHRYELPPEFPLTSLYSDIVHHLSGPNTDADTQTSLRKYRSNGAASIATVTLTMQMGVIPTHLRMCVDSLVRVSRRAVGNLTSRHLVVPPICLWFIGARSIHVYVTFLEL